MKKCNILWLFLLFLSIFFSSCEFFKTLTKSEYAKETGKDNPNLSLLAVPPCQLSEQFSKNITNYTVSLPSNISSIAIVALTEIAEASIEVNGAAAKKNSLSNKINVSSLNIGESTVITVKVKTDYLDMTKKYYITATKTADTLTFNEDFETGDFSKYGWIVKGDKISIQSDDKYQGQYAGKFGKITYEKHYNFNTFISKTSNATVSFYYKKPFVEYTDPDMIYFTILIDNIYSYSLTSASWHIFSFTLPPGEHILSWNIATYYLPVSGDFAFIDNILIQ